MRLLYFSFITIVATSSTVYAQSPFDEHPQTHTEYDWQSGNRYQIEHHNDAFEQDTHVRGYNFNTGSNWETTIDNEGDMRGRDAEGNSWKYDEGSGFYQNFGTGKTCIGKGAARSCF